MTIIAGTGLLAGYAEAKSDPAFRSDADAAECERHGEPFDADVLRGELRRLLARVTL